MDTDNKRRGLLHLSGGNGNPGAHKVKTKGGISLSGGADLTSSDTKVHKFKKKRKKDHSQDDNKYKSHKSHNQNTYWRTNTKSTHKDNSPVPLSPSSSSLFVSSATTSSIPSSSSNSSSSGVRSVPSSSVSSSDIYTPNPNVLPSSSSSVPTASLQPEPYPHLWMKNTSNL